MNKPVIAFDFDGVIATFEGWKGFDVLGEPISETIEAMKQLHRDGLFITIYTGRTVTPTLLKWLKDNNVPYDSINSTAHNYEFSSQKPRWNAYIGDRAINFNIDTNRLSTKELIKQINETSEQYKRDSNE